ncbi:Hypothetical protein LUCI_3311 [Lucifera butyrica]|uniref:Uncharacterized protein n=1 Tax=Lucifera butyrica TaxID=1351585 RepID=A0A498R5Q1_9FIRM|nr:DHH family phosphoesterase [Lucifera butyrica]VBB08046.1 Hypothetical protein LUCI_3311 [Lucifera butyrica]
MEISLKQASELLERAANIVLTAHIYPDGDSLGSMLALFHSLRAAGKDVTMLLDDDVPKLYQYLPGQEKIVRPRSGLNADLLVVLDASDEERIGAVKTAVFAPILNLDHHLSNTRFADYWYVDAEAAATGEIIFKLLGLMNGKITREIAVCLYTAIATDCGFFRYANTSAATMRYAAELIECGVQPHVIAEHLDTRPLANIILLTKALATLQLYEAGRIATITLSAEMGQITSDNTEGFINYPRNIEGVEIAVLFKVVDTNTVRVSLRSRNVDVSRLALAFGGGGHARAAGCTLNGTLEDAKTKIIGAAVARLKESPV